MQLPTRSPIVVLAAALLRLAPTVAAHGQINRVVAEGVSNDGPNVCLSWEYSPPIIQLGS